MNERPLLTLIGIVVASVAIVLAVPHFFEWLSGLPGYPAVNEWLKQLLGL